MKIKSKTNATYYSCLWLIIGMLFLSSCSNDNSFELDYSFKGAVDVKENINDFNRVEFKSYKNLDLGFHKGNVWIKLEVLNGNKQSSYIVLTEDLINRNYKFFKLDSRGNNIKPIPFSKDFTKHDHRTYNHPKPNFRIDLAPKEQATYIITTESDGRIVQATPKLLQLEDYTNLMDRTTLINVLFFIVIGILFLINLFHWSILKSKLYYYYGFYIISSCLFYLNVEGYLYGLGFSHVTIDHFMFICIRLWILALVMFTAKFLELNITHPKYYQYIKWFLFAILGTTTLYQLLFFNSSISNLHIVENIFGFFWIIISIIMIRLSFKKRRLETRYYLISFSFLVFFITLGLIDSHTALLAGDPFSYFKIGTIIEFIGFTYFISLIIKNNLKKADVLENELIQNQKELLLISEQLKSNLVQPSKKKVIEKTDLLNIFKLLKSSLSTEDEWSNFKFKLEELSPYFLVNLKEKHPDLSKSEVRLLILIRIGFTQKEIANTLNIAPESSKKAKQRVRKKLNVSSSNLLNDYLVNFD